jgi:hypothetical protein
MKLASFEAIVQALNGAGVRYLVAGGLAVNAHGYLRFTKDVDLVIRLSRKDILGAFRALAAIGYQPKVPITAEQFADGPLRESWIRDKGMVVMNLWSDRHRETPVDIFVREPFDFKVEYARAWRGGDPPALFVAIPALIAMKQTAGRPQDLIDIEKLRQIAKINDE